MPRDGTLVKEALVCDLFCGAGGSSLGAQRALAALGYRMNLLAINHWSTAIETHSANFPEARHLVQDVTTAKPGELVPEGKLDLLMASPTCTFHSRARGGKPINDQQRMDPWAIVHWCTELRVKRLLVENVPEFRDWGPVDLRTSKPNRRLKGKYFLAWVGALEAAGFKVEWRVLNAADFGDATTRERFFLMARSDGRRIVWPTPTHSKRGSNADLLGHVTRPWRAAREIIDWSIEGKSIFDRKRPLAPKTLRRIYAGAVKLRWPDPFLVILRNHMDAQSIDDPIPAICAGGTHIGLAEPFTLSVSNNGAARPAALIEPIVFQLNQGKDRQFNIRSADDPLCTITATGTDLGLVEPFILNRHGENGATRAHPVDEPVPTADCRGAGYLVEPLLMRSDQTGGGGLNVRSVEDPVFTVTGNHGGGMAIVEPLVVNLAHSGHDGTRCRTVDEPLQTLHASVEGPLPSVTTKGRFGLVVPVTHGGDGGPGPRSLEDPLPTMTTAKGGEFALVMPVTRGNDAGRVRSPDEPLPTITGAPRGELACIVAAFGEREGQAPRVHSVDDPTPTICATGRIQLAVAVADTRTYDIRFRMLEPEELARAMGFSDGEVAYEFTGTKTAKTKMIGNAIPVNTASALVAALMGN